MKNLLPVVIILFSLIISFGCEKKQETPPLKTQQFSPVQAPIQTPMDKPIGKPHSPHSAAVKDDRKIEIPAEVKKSWTEVKFIFEDKNTKKQSEFRAKIHSEINIPGTELKIVFGDFIPDFKMEKNIITSKSNEPNNPAVRVEIFEKGKTIFTGWLYAKYPDIHPFEHRRYSIVLKEGIRRP